MNDASDLIRAAKLAWDKHEWGACWKFANQALNEEPDRAEGLYLAGCALREMGHVGLAIAVFRRALALNPTHLNLWMHFAATLHDLNQWDEARDAYQMILKQMPNEAAAMANIAAGYVQTGEPRKAVEWAEKALAIRPDQHIGRIARCFGNLGLGRWRDGWQDAEFLYGHHLLTRVYNKRENEEPIWDGQPGQTVVVTMDQGLGDQIMFAQCLPQMIADCKAVIVECEPRMINVWRRNFPGLAAIYGTVGEVELAWPKQHPIDAHIHVSWLGRYYRNSNAEFPRTAYLTADPAKVAKWRAILEPQPKPWLGLAWRGGIQRTSKHLRSVSLAEYAPIMGFAGTLIDLSYHDSMREVALWNIKLGQQVLSPDIDTTDYEDTIAIASAMDDVVTVTTTLAHVCGALGRHAYVLVPQAPQWRYQHGAEGGLYWYAQDSVELMRQAPGETDWSHTIARLAKRMAPIAELRMAAA